jgi:tRNA (cmo5U34)-methyltransferase
MSKDTLYAHKNVAPGPFEFNEDVARVFPDMLKRSIPGYAATIQAIGTLAASLVQPGSRCYDLGCSLGAATLAMRRNIVAAGCRIIAVDNAPAMVSRCRELLAADEKPGPAEVSVIEANIQEVEIARASMVVLNYTLQFLPLEERLALVRKIAVGMNPGGILVLSEKVVDEDPVVEETLQNLHHEFKRRNVYSDLEISRKRTALENVLVPETVKVHEQRLRDAGFRHVGVWLRYFNFVSIIAIR